MNKEPELKIVEVEVEEEQSRIDKLNEIISRYNELNKKLDETLLKIKERKNAKINSKKHTT